MSTELRIKNLVREIRTALENGISELRRVGQLYVAAITENPEMKQVIQEAIPEISPSTWSRFELLGRGQARAELIYDNSLPARYLIRCPVSEQEKYLSSTVTLLLDNGDSLQVDLHHLSKEQTKQVFAYDHVRSLPEQKVWLEQARKEAREAIRFEKSVPAYEIVKKRVRFNKDVELCRKEVAEILAKLS